MTNSTLSGAKNCLDDPASCLCGGSGGDAVVSGVVSGVVNATVIAPENDDDEGAALYIILVVFTYRCVLADARMRLLACVCMC